MASNQSNTRKQVKRGEFGYTSDCKPHPSHQILPNRTGSVSVRKERNVAGQNREGFGGDRSKRIKP
jgi:hypothetical protein